MKSSLLCRNSTFISYFSFSFRSPVWNALVSDVNLFVFPESLNRNKNEKKQQQQKPNKNMPKNEWKMATKIYHTVHIIIEHRREYFSKHRIDRITLFLWFSFIRWTTYDRRILDDGAKFTVSNFKNFQTVG